MTTTILVVLGLGGFGAGFVKSAFGIGSGVLFAPVMAMFMEPRLAVGLTASLMLVTDITTIHVHWRRWEWHVLKHLLPTALIGTVLGTYLLAWAPATLVRQLIGIVALSFGVVQIYRLVQQKRNGGPLEFSRSSPVLALAFGIVGGIASAIAHSGGLVFSFYLLPRQNKAAFVASLALALLVLDCVKMLSFWQFGVVPLRELLIGLLFAPLMFAGSWLGSRLNGRLSERRFLILVIILVSATGVGLLLR